MQIMLEKCALLWPVGLTGGTHRPASRTSMEIESKQK
jgi:hypothetical protein